MFVTLDSKSHTVMFVLEIASYMAVFGWRPDDDREYYQLVLDWAKDWHDWWVPRAEAGEVDWQFFFEATSEFVREKLKEMGHDIPGLVTYNTTGV